MELPDAGNHDAEWPVLRDLIGAAIAVNASRHPGIIAEAIVEQLDATFVMTSRETNFSEQRANHRERVRLISHQIFRAHESTPEVEPGREIATRLFDCLIFTRRPGAGSCRESRP